MLIIHYNESRELVKNIILLLLFITNMSQAKTIRVLEVDTGVDLSHKAIRDHVNPLEWTTSDYVDLHGHGTHIAGLLVEDTCPEVELTSCRYMTVRGTGTSSASSNCFKRALESQFDIINYSSSGFEFNLEEYHVLKAISKLGTRIVVSAGNEGMNLSSDFIDVYPAEYEDIKNLIVVGNSTHKSSNYGLDGMFWENGTSIISTLPNNMFGKMTGTSQATAIYTNKLLKKKCAGEVK